MGSTTRALSLISCVSLSLSLSLSLSRSTSTNGGLTPPAWLSLGALGRRSVVLVTATHGGARSNGNGELDPMVARKSRIRQQWRAEELDLQVAGTPLLAAATWESQMQWQPTREPPPSGGRRSGEPDPSMAQARRPLPGAAGHKSWMR